MDIVNTILTFGIPGSILFGLANNWRTRRRRWLESMDYDELLVADISEKERQRELAKFVWVDDGVDDSNGSVAQSEKQSMPDIIRPVSSLLPAVDTNKSQPVDIKSVSDFTIQSVRNLPDRVQWPIDKLVPERIPLLYDGNKWMYLNLHASEHVVVCGSSRSGKGNLLQLVGLSALMLGPGEVQVWFLDAKQGLDYSFATKLAHARLYADVTNELGELLSDGGLDQGFIDIESEMNHRNSLLFDKARNIHEYAMKTGDRWPIIILVVDEAAELTKEQKAKLSKIARMSAASGFILMTSTQYPTVDVLSSQIQSNALIRVCLKLSSGKYTPVALSLAPGESSKYDPAAIEPRGVAIHRYTGKEMVGRIPEITSEDRSDVINYLENQWPRLVVKEDQELLISYLDQPTPRNEVTSTCNEVAPLQHGVTALLRGVTDSVTVTETPPTPAEVALIARQLALGITPSAIAKMLPNYNPRKYDESRSKVDYVQALLVDR